ncbi:MAG TPA: hypothetical protein VGZ22_18000 [Isosphaeraceae bacterium]|nr:hypothetical protein [Isosphaeraceae bacterium]
MPEYLGTDLHLVRTTGHEQADLMIDLDPMAEYLGALYLVERNAARSGTGRFEADSKRNIFYA